ncbi:hypothetical protein [Streptomyces zingiberis]|uniref:WXG100 family type VII secretion target n=1 Tax=Streptomyces zingiberis TaxID=2053010 RepID=A0ABX1C2I9_9ACTN|nr:hypothetical protein [Streptomyces zingiberis]NJQ02996.1 hypothetical protein [Streptomyces zingiberis]
MSYHGRSFEADPALLRAFIEESQAIGKEIRAMSRDFTRALEPTTPWYGYGGPHDKFGSEIGPEDQKDREFVTGCLDAIADGFIGMTDGRLQELEQIRNAQNFALDGMDELKSGLDDVGRGGGGGRH